MWLYSSWMFLLMSCFHGIDGWNYFNGKKGPAPRKKVIRELSKLCPVLLVDEYRTSKACHRCGQDVQEMTADRVQICGNTLRNGEQCPMRVDRDINGAANIGQAGTCMLYGEDRPQHLRRPTTSTTKTPKKTKKRKILRVSVSAPKKRTRRS